MNLRITNINKNRKPNHFFYFKDKKNFPFLLVLTLLSVKPWLATSVKAPLKTNYFYK